MQTKDASRQAKREIRGRILALRDDLPEEQRQRLGRLIGQRLLDLPEFEKAVRVAFFASFGSEVPTLETISRAIDSGKEVYLPVTDRKNRRLDFHRLRDPGTDLIKGAYGILEPVPSGAPAPVGSFEVIVTPGVAFDRDGLRVGYGGGFYDRVFDEAGLNVLRAAMAFDLQLVEQVPREVTDLPVHVLITEERVLRFR